MRIDRRRYAELYGPTVGDRVRLGDTNLFISPTDDLTRDASGGAGDEAVFGGGKVIRESMGQATRSTIDLVITNVVVLDWWGVVKADVGVRDGRIVALGKAGNPDITDGVHPELVIGPSTEVLAGEGKILTAGGIDCHVHLICPQILDEALATGITTVVGGGTGPAEGTKATTCTPGAWYLARMLEAIDAWPINVALLAKGNTVSAAGARGPAPRRRVGLQAARGLGHDAGGDRRLPHGLRPLRRAGRDPHRHAERGGLRRRHPRRHRRALDPQLPHRGRGRRPRARHHHGRLPPQRAAVVDQPDPPAHRQHDRRAPRHVDGVPPPQPEGAGGPGVRREPHPSLDDRRRGLAARPRGDLDHRLRQPGDGSRRRGRSPAPSRPPT